MKQQTKMFSKKFVYCILFDFKNDSELFESFSKISALICLKLTENILFCLLKLRKNFHIFEKV